MSNDGTANAAHAAIAVMNLLQPLSPEERERVLQSAAALFAVSSLVAPAATMGSSGQAEASALAGASNSMKRLSIVELLQQKAAATNPQRIACFAYYREKVEGHQKFAKRDLSVYFPQAKLPAPGPNYSRDYNNAVKEGWIHDDGAASYLTQKGENAVEAGFGGKAKPRGATGGGKKRRAGRAE